MTTWNRFVLAVALALLSQVTANLAKGAGYPELAGWPLAIVFFVLFLVLGYWVPWDGSADQGPSDEGGPGGA